MKAKYLLTALALPALFAACSQEEIVSEVQQQQPTELLGKLAGEVSFTFGPQSRLAWGADGKKTWAEDKSDEFSLFWVSESAALPSDEGEYTAVGTLKGSANALYKQTEEGTFTSENILYEGKHIMVFPVNKKHYGAKNIVVSVDQKQDGSVDLGNRSVFTNDTLLTIKAMPEDVEEDELQDTIVYAAGYKKAVPATIKPLTSNIVLNLDFLMSDKVESVTVKEVNLKTKDAVFALTGNLKGGANDEVTFAVSGTKVDKIGVTMPAGTTVTKDKGAVAQIAVLPIELNTDEEVTPAAEGDSDEPAVNPYAIEVVTNYGVVTIDSAKWVTNNAGVYAAKNNTAENQKKDKFDVEEYGLDLSEEFGLTTNLASEITYRGQKAEVDPSYGKTIRLKVTVDMSKASIDNMEVTTSDELVDAYTTYDLLEKKDAVNFVLKSDKPFELDEDAVKAILGNDKVTLTFKHTSEKINDSIMLVGSQTAIPSFLMIGEDDASVFGDASVALILGAEGTWAIDVDKAAAANQWNEIINQGTLTLSESNPDEDDEEAVALTTKLTNENAVQFGSNVDVPVAYTQNAGTTTVGTAYTVNIMQSANIVKGSVDINGKLISYSGTTQIQKGATVAVSGALLNNNENDTKLENAGTITLEGAGRTIISANQITDKEEVTNIGSIVCASRTSSVNVGDENAQGYIKWTCTESKYKKETRDAFNYLILTKNTEFDTTYDNIKHIEVAATIEVVGEHNSLTTVKVNSGNTLIIPTGSEISAETTVLDGDIEVYGTYSQGTLKYTDNNKKGKIYYYNNRLTASDAQGLSTALASGKDVKLSSSFTVNSSLTIPADKEVTIDLNGKTITAETEIPFLVSEGATLNVKNGTIDSKADAIKVVGNNVTINIGEDVTIKSENNTCIWVNDDEGQQNITINIAGNLESKSTSDAAVYVSGNLNNGKKVTMNITGGSIVSENSTAVYFPADGNLTISGGEITGKECAVEYRGTGLLKITGGTFTSTGSTFTQQANGNGTTTVAAAVAVVPHNDRTSSVEFTGGTFKATNDACYAYWIGVKTEADTSLTTGTIDNVSIRGVSIITGLSWYQL